jgi:hypothetical protein
MMDVTDTTQYCLCSNATFGEIANNQRRHPPHQAGSHLAIIHARLAKQNGSDLRHN